MAVLGAAYTWMVMLDALEQLPLLNRHWYTDNPTPRLETVAFGTVLLLSTPPGPEISDQVPIPSEGELAVITTEPVLAQSV